MNRLANGSRNTFRRLTRMAIAALTFPAVESSIALAIEPPDESVLQQFRRETEALLPWVTTDLARRFLEGVTGLPAVSSRTVYSDTEKKTVYTADEAAGLTTEQRTALKERVLDGTFYYTTRYGTPLAYSRPLDILGQAGLTDVAGKRILDFGYGAIGHLRLLAGLGADVVGVEVDPLLRALYSAPGDQGVVTGSGGKQGRLGLVHGRWPTEETARQGVGRGYDLILSKNTLKNGYIHPAQSVDPRMTIDLGVDDAEFVRALYDALKPGGRVLIYNLCPAPAAPDKPYIPWADGRSPFSKDLLESSGFKVIAFDVDDSTPAREMGKKLGWDQGEGAMNLQNDLFALYTLVERPVR